MQTLSNSMRSTVDFHSAIDTELYKLKDEEKQLQSLLATKTRKDLIDYLEAELAMDNVKQLAHNIEKSTLATTATMPSGTGTLAPASSRFQTTFEKRSNKRQVANLLDSIQHQRDELTASHVELHKIADQCPICLEDQISTVYRNDESQNFIKYAANHPAFKNSKISHTSEVTRPRVIYASKKSVPKYSSTANYAGTPLNSTTTAATIAPVQDVNGHYDNSERLSRSYSDLATTHARRFEEDPSVSWKANPYARSTSIERAYTKAIRDKYFYNQYASLSQAALKREQQRLARSDGYQHYQTLPMSRTVVHDRPWSYGLGTLKNKTTYYPYRDAKLQKSLSKQVAMFH